MAKFTKEEAIESLKARLPQNRVLSDRTIAEAVEALFAFVGDETELSNFENNVLSVLSSFDGQQRHIVSDYEKRLAETVKPTKKETEENLEETSKEKGQHDGLTLKEVEELIERREAAKEAALQQQREAEATATTRKATRDRIRQDTLKGLNPAIAALIGNPADDADDNAVKEFYANAKQTFVAQGIRVEDSVSGVDPKVDPLEARAAQVEQKTNELLNPKN